MKILNLGCGTDPCPHQDVINIDWSIYLRMRQSRLLRALTPCILRGERLEKFKTLPGNIRVHNLRKRLPFESESVDVVYHSHVLEHFDRDAAMDFMKEIYRVLKSGGIQRIAVPDFEKLCRDYVAHCDRCDGSLDDSRTHDAYVGKIIEQSVRREAYGTARQKPIRRFVENRLLGDARKRGETHQWMYDRINLKSKLAELGYSDIVVQPFNVSLVPQWSSYGLDLAKHKDESLYIDAVK
ncbi:MAG: class I SAM-dependent methyltransferase [Kiritimatiellales bacterium]|nr:class I SAM-dependent methyltransferase [Kiritimatiellales bacterium]